MANQIGSVQINTSMKAASIYGQPGVIYMQILRAAGDILDEISVAYEQWKT